MVQSMTSFARRQAQGDWGQAVWEIRSVNHRYLEMGFRLPEEFRELELELRDVVREHAQRGKVDSSLSFTAGDAVGIEVVVNKPLANALVKASADLRREILDDAAPLRSMDVLRWPGVAGVHETNLEAAKVAIKDLYSQAVIDLVKRRSNEGASLSDLLIKRLDGIEVEIEKVQKVLPQVITDQRNKLKEKLTQMQLEVDENRLEQEIVIVAQKMDVAEEMDRLGTHIIEVRRVLKKGGVIGRRLDFLMQELNREANTLASKSMHSQTTQSAVEMKVLIEQMREQVQNIE